ncbi:SMYD3-like protein [Mya arenaria]|uniref:SMYD3-like protein n=1 Tax=Mya arenaria TaxID=6604 RepID=A0ABY7FH21_MYAAR|nr:SMYD3-like protein [Mya arenaria]
MYWMFGHILLQQSLPDSEDIKKDAERSEQFAQVAFTLKEYAGSHVSLPDASKLLNLFGKVFISYIDQLAPRKERQTALKKQYYFDCACSRCSDEQFWKGVFETCKESIQKAAGVLHAHNVYLVRILDLAFDAAINLEKWELAAKYGARTLQPYCTFYGEMSPHLAVQLFKVGKLQLYLGDDLKGALQSLERAQNIFKVTQGEGHEILNTLELFVGQCREEMRMKLEKS